MQGDSKFQLLEYEKLEGATDIKTMFGLNIVKKCGITLKQIRILLDDSEVVLEAGLLSYMKGSIEIKNKMGGILGIGRKFIESKVTGESMFKPKYIGSGEIFLEPSFCNFALIELEDDEIIVDDGMFCACDGEIEVGVSLQKNVSSSFLGNKGFCQTRLTGSGVVVLKIPVPQDEIFKCTLIDDTLKVDGNFAILRTGNIEFSVEKSSKSIIGSMTNGEGLVNVYSGTGEIWLVPTKNVYQELKINTFDRTLEEDNEDTDEFE